MAEEKKTQLSIVIRTIDQATAKLKAINERLDEVTKPTRDFRKQLGELAEKSGLSSVAEGFKGVGEAVKETLFKVLEMGAVIGEAAHLVLELVEHFDELGKKAERIGVTADFLAGMRDAAERSGASVEQLDSGLQSFSENLGQARAGTGRMLKFLNMVSPALASQVVHAKSTGEAFDLLSNAMAKIQDPAKRAALAQKTVGDAALAPLLARGSKGVKELRDHYAELAGSQEGAVAASTETHEAMLDLKASTDGVKAALVEGLAPALTEIIKKITQWLGGHREDIKQWAAAFGKKLPDAFQAVVGAIGSVIDVIKPFVDSGTKLKIVALAIAAAIVGPLIMAIGSLGIALLTTPIGWILAGLTALGVAAYELVKHWDGVKAFFVGLWDGIKAKFGWVADVVAVVLAPFIAIPAEIIGHWDAITSFFSDLWDGVTAVFQKAWDFIGGIIDKIVAGVDKIKEVAGDIKDAFTGSVGFDAMQEQLRRKVEAANGSPLGAPVGAQAQAAMVGAANANSSSAKVTVDFANAPRGTRVAADPRSTADVDLSVGYQLGGAMP